MTDVVVFHHALGITDGIDAFADVLRARGHRVTVPDLFEGRRFDTIEAGVAHAQEVGFDTILDRGRAAVEDHPAGCVYIGFSLGVLPAQLLAQTRPGAGGAVLCYSCVPLGEFAPTWPAGVAVQVHGMDADPYFVGEGDLDAAREVVSTADDGELFLYPGDQHYFADRSQPSYDADATALLERRVVELLARLS